MTAFHIDPATGDLVFPEAGVRIRRFSKWKELPDAVLPLAGPALDMKTGWNWRRLTGISFQELPVGAMLGYHNDRLEMFNFGLISESEGWPTQEEAMEEERVLQAALAQHLGVPLDSRGQAQFPWGAAFCAFHPKDQATTAGVNYTYFG